jgi:hypothetical protein
MTEGGEVGVGVAGLGAMASLMGPELSESAFRLCIGATACELPWLSLPCSAAISRVLCDFGPGLSVDDTNVFYSMHAASAMSDKTCPWVPKTMHCCLKQPVCVNVHTCYTGQSCRHEQKSIVLTEKKQLSTLALGN